jgi:hypothetical protein
MRKSFTFEHFWSKNATTGHVLLSSVCVSTSPNILRPDLPQALQDLTGVYCRFDATMAISLTRRGPGQWPGLMEGSLFRSIQHLDENVRAIVFFEDSLNSRRP